eukprot:COSAG05_NODE_58_length_23277_cov_16.934162_4_plen_173_part_00
MVSATASGALAQRWYDEDIVVTPMAVAWSRSLGLRKLIYYHCPGANTSIILRYRHNIILSLSAHQTLQCRQTAVHDRHTFAHARLRPFDLPQCHSQFLPFCNNGPSAAAVRSSAPSLKRSQLSYQLAVCPRLGIRISQQPWTFCCQLSQTNEIDTFPILLHKPFFGPWPYYL